MVLKWLPVAKNSALEGQAAEAGESPIKSVLRSKGFMWMSYSHASAFYWSHAGQHFDIRDEGDWWGSSVFEHLTALSRTTKTTGFLCSSSRSLHYSGE